MTISTLLSFMVVISSPVKRILVKLKCDYACCTQSGTLHSTNMNCSYVLQSCINEDSSTAHFHICKLLFDFQTERFYMEANQWTLEYPWTIVTKWIILKWVYV